VSSTTVRCAKMAEPIEMPIGGRTRLGPRNMVLGRFPDPLREWAFFGEEQVSETYVRMRALRTLCLPSRDVAQRPRCMSAFADAKYDKTRRCGVLPNYFRHLFSPLGKPDDLALYRPILPSIILNSAKDLLDRFSRFFHLMEGICVNVVNPGQIFRFPKGCCHGNQFWVKWAK